jgi:pimeloyl-ACP methyl ester carboxylesterase
LMTGLAAAAMLLGIGPAHADTRDSLARRATLGIAIEAGQGGARVRSIAPDSTAARAGLRVGDIVTRLNNVPTPDHLALVAQAGQLRAGDIARFAYTRDGVAARATAPALARPLETYTRAQAKYGAVAFRGGQLRDILVTPDNARADAPVAYLIQGYYCGSMEGPVPEHPYRALAQGLATNGIATYRVEKPGMGDSRGGPACLDTDFAAELDAFRAGLKALIETHGVRSNRIVLLGHSMGGVEAPLLAAETDGLRGVAVYGTVLRSWRDYMQDLVRTQSFLSSGHDPAQGEALGEEIRVLLNRVFDEVTPLSQMAAESPKTAALLRDVLQWDGDKLILGRTAAYWRGVNEQRLTAAWKEVDTPVLTLYGEADFAALDDSDHRMIAEIVNHYRPGTARFATLPRTGHGFGLEGDRESARRANAADPAASSTASYNPELTKVLSDWIGSLPPG